MVAARASPKVQRAGVQRPPNLARELPRGPDARLADVDALKTSRYANHFTFETGGVVDVDIESILNEDGISPLLRQAVQGYVAMMTGSSDMQQCWVEALQELYSLYSHGQGSALERAAMEQMLADRNPTVAMAIPQVTHPLEEIAYFHCVAPSQQTEIKKGAIVNTHTTVVDYQDLLETMGFERIYRAAQLAIAEGVENKEKKLKKGEAPPLFLEQEKREALLWTTGFARLMHDFRVYDAKFMRPYSELELALRGLQAGGIQEANWDSLDQQAKACANGINNLLVPYTGGRTGYGATGGSGFYTTSGPVKKAVYALGLVLILGLTSCTALAPTTQGGGGGGGQPDSGHETAPGACIIQRGYLSRADYNDIYSALRQLYQPPSAGQVLVDFDHDPKAEYDYCIVKNEDGRVTAVEVHKFTDGDLNAAVSINLARKNNLIWADPTTEPAPPPVFPTQQPTPTCAAPNQDSYSHTFASGDTVIGLWEQDTCIRDLFGGNQAKYLLFWEQEFGGPNQVREGKRYVIERPRVDAFLLTGHVPPPPTPTPIPPQVIIGNGQGPLDQLGPNWGDWYAVLEGECVKLNRLYENGDIRGDPTADFWQVWQAGNQVWNPNSPPPGYDCPK